MQVLTDRAAMVEPHAGIDREAVPERNGVTHKHTGRDELPADMFGSIEILDGPPLLSMYSHRSE